jgi:hypothetical protein
MAKKDKRPTDGQEKKLRRDFAQPVLDMRGKPVMLGASLQSLQKAISRFIREADSAAVDLFKEILDEEGLEEMTLGVAAIESLGGAYEDEKGLAMDTRNTRFLLGLRITEAMQNGGICEITPDERDKIKELVRKNFTGSVIAPRVSQLLEIDADEQDKPPLQAVA